jgi:elongation factor Tu
VAWFRRTEAESLDPQVLLAQANAAEPVAAPAADSGFRLTVADVFSIRDRGTVVTGDVDSGTVRKGDTVRLTRADGSVRQLTVDGIEMFRKVTETASAGDNVGLLLRAIGRDDVGRGDVLSR